MTDRAKFEQMLELLINEDKEKAQELFHELVVAKSREIYENLLDDDMQVDTQTSEDFGVSEVSDDKADDELDDIEADDAEEFGGDEEGDEEGEGEEGGDEPATKDDLDLMKQDIIDELTAEFEAMMAGGSEGGEEEPDMGMDMGGEMGAEEPKEEEFVLEYVEKVGTPKGGDNGANAKSIVAGKNDMGGTAGNIAKGGESKGEGTKGGLLNPATKDLNSGNVNTPGSKTATKLSSVAKGHGAEKKGSGDNGANTKSTLGS